MKWKTFIIGYALAVAVFLFAQRSPQARNSAMFTSVIDLTQSLDESFPNWEGTGESPFKAQELGNLDRHGYFTRYLHLPEHHGTHIDAPAHFGKGGWTVDQIPVENLIAPLVVLDVRSKVRSSPDYAVSMEDVIAWEREHGHIPLRAVVVANTGWARKADSQKEYLNFQADGLPHYPGFAPETVEFLVQNRNVVGVGIDTMSVDIGATTTYPIHQYTGKNNVYHLENLGILDTVPANGAIVTIGAAKLKGGSGGPVRVLAMVPSREKS